MVGEAQDAPKKDHQAPTLPGPGDSHPRGGGAMRRRRGGGAPQARYFRRSALDFFSFLLSAAAFVAFAVRHASLQPVTIFVQARDQGSFRKVSDDTILYRESGTIYCMYRVTGI